MSWSPTSAACGTNSVVLCAASRWPPKVQRPSRLPDIGLLLLGIAIVVFAFPGGLWACTTPVYQYAMYNWPPSPYYVFFFHEGPIAEADKNLHQMAEKMATEGQAVANLVLYPVDLAEKEQFERLPESVRKSWETYRDKHKDEQAAVTSGYAVYTAWGAELFVGQLDTHTLQAMVDSPARVKLGQLFQEGSAMVVLFVPGTKQEENQRAKKIIQSLIDEVATGKLMGMPIYSPLDAYGPIGPPLEPVAQGGDQPPGEQSADQPASETDPESADNSAGSAPAQSDSAEETADDQQEPQGRGLKIGLLTVRRDDPQERWLVRSLMAIDPELEKLKDEPMLFFCYGRGRAMPPYVGEGITMENLAGEIQFLSGACSCMVKDANPGIDLLMKWDWDATAEAIALAYDPQFQASFGVGYQEVDAAGMPDEQPQQPPEEVAPAEADSTASPPAESVTETQLSREESQSLLADSVAEASAANQEVLAGSAGQGDESSPNLPDSSDRAAAGSVQQPSDDQSTGTEQEEPPVSTSAEPTDVAFAPKAGVTPPGGIPPSPLVGQAEATDAGHATVPPVPMETEEGSFVQRQMWLVAAGLIGAVVILLVVSRFALGR